jgi:endonuclease YncB( thermonuclease family)
MDTGRRRDGLSKVDADAPRARQERPRLNGGWQGPSWLRGGQPQVSREADPGSGEPPRPVRKAFTRRAAFGAAGVGALLAAAAALAVFAPVRMSRPPEPKAAKPEADTAASGPAAGVRARELPEAGLLDPARLGPAQAFAERLSTVPVTHFARTGGGKLDDRLPGAAIPQPGEKLSVSAPYIVMDSRSFAARGRVLVLAHVEGPERNGVCFDRSDNPFACGLNARAALHNLIARLDLTCSVLQALDDERVEVSCAGAPGDIAVQLAAQGWVRPASTGGRAPDDLSQAAAAARQAGAGAWNGGWRIRPPPAE